jgi:type I restriction enzyme S subunit
MMRCVLKDLIEVSKDGEWGKGEPFADSVEMLAIRGTDFEDARFGITDSTPRRHIARRHAERKRLQPWDVVIEAAGGTKDQITGRTVLLRPQLFSRSPLPFTCASFSRFIRFNSELCDAAFMFWYLQYLYASGVMHAYHTQHTGVARFQWTTFSERETLEIPVLPVQRRIAGILSAYDELIENNLRRIRLLEAMAHALYRECLHLADAAAPPHTVTECDYWTFISANVALYQGTKRYYATADVEKLAITGAGIDYSFPEKPSRAQKQPTPFSVWFARMKDTYKIAWYGKFNSQSADSSLLSSGFAGFQALDPVYFPLLFLTITSAEFHAQKDLFCTGATQMSLTNEGLGRIQMPIPKEPLARRLGMQALPLLNRMLTLQLTIQNLRRTRDLLLPRLMSGQIRLDEAAA